MSHNDLLAALKLPEDQGSPRSEGSAGSLRSSSSSIRSIPLEGVDLNDNKAGSSALNQNIPEDNMASRTSTYDTQTIDSFAADRRRSSFRSSLSSVTRSVAPFATNTRPPSQGNDVTNFKNVDYHDRTSYGSTGQHSFSPEPVTPKPTNPTFIDIDVDQKRAPSPLDRASIASSTTSSQRKLRPDSLLPAAKEGKLILGIALVDFNHSVGPRVEMAYPESLHEDEELCKILPFLALPDGAHQSAEDYSYFHLVLEDPPTPTGSPDTVFGISCNRQIAASDLLEKDADVSRSTVQKAVVVLASKPVFGPIRDKLGVVTRALFNQRDFRDTHILLDFYTILEDSLKSQLTESGLYMGTSLRELIHNFRHRTLILLKLLMLQKKVMFYGHPVERLCTFQYSLVSLIPNLFLALEDAASPNLDRREHDNTVPTELRTSDKNSLMRYMGLPLNVFGRDAFFQPYLPLQQVDMLKTKSWLCGTTNSIVTQQRDSLPDLLINIELNTFEFNDPKVERIVALTAADRQWMDNLVNDVNDGWNERDPSRPLTMQFKGSDDYLRAKFEDYICSALSSVKYGDFLQKASKSEVGIMGTGDENPGAHFGEAWVTAFRLTNAYEHWSRVTDPALFDICEPRHPCDTTPTVISDIGLRLAEGIHDLKIAETVAPTRDAISQAISAGSSGFFKAFEGVRSEVAARMAARNASSSSATASPPPSAKTLTDSTSTLQAQQANLETFQPSPRNSRTEYPPMPRSPTGQTTRGLKPLSLANSAKPGPPGAVAGVDVGAAGQAAKSALSSWGSFIAKKAADIKRSNTMPAQPPAPPIETVEATTSKTTSLRSPPLGFRGGLWSLGERAGPSEPEKSNDPGTKSTG